MIFAGIDHDTVRFTVRVNHIAVRGKYTDLHYVNLNHDLLELLELGLDPVGNRPEVQH